MNRLAFNRVARAAYRAVLQRAPGSLAPWESLDSTARTAWYAQVESLYNAGAIAGIEAARHD